MKNKKGYMLVELILASAITFAMSYFVIDLTLKIKEKNDDLIIETLVATDRAILANSMMKEVMAAYASGLGVECQSKYVNQGSASDNEKAFSYFADKKLIFNKYMDFYNNESNPNDCKDDKNNKTFKYTVHISVKEMPDKNFDVPLIYKYG